MPYSTRKDFVPIALRGKEEEYLGNMKPSIARGSAGVYAVRTCGKFAPRMFVYVVGEFNASECQAVYDLQRQLNSDITLIGPDMLCPQVFTDCILKESETTGL